jgi:hypothetical protein
MVIDVKIEELKGERRILNLKAAYLEEHDLKESRSFYLC